MFLQWDQLILNICSCGTMAYEIYYAFATTSTAFEKISFLAWFLLDVSFAAVAILSAYRPERRKLVTTRMAAGVLLGLLFLHGLCLRFPDEREQVTAYWTGLLLQLPIVSASRAICISRWLRGLEERLLLPYKSHFRDFADPFSFCFQGWGSLCLLLHRGETKGHSLEIWYGIQLALDLSLLTRARLTRFLGCFTAYGVFFWRFVSTHCRDGIIQWSQSNIWVSPPRLLRSHKGF